MDLFALFPAEQNILLIFKNRTYLVALNFSKIKMPAAMSKSSTFGCFQSNAPLQTDIMMSCALILSFLTKIKSQLFWFFCALYSEHRLRAEYRVNCWNLLENLIYNFKANKFLQIISFLSFKMEVLSLFKMKLYYIYTQINIYSLILTNQMIDFIKQIYMLASS